MNRKLNHQPQTMKREELGANKQRQNNFSQFLSNAEIVQVFSPLHFEH